jgi:penicillin-insensitive murein endopeptidase
VVLLRKSIPQRTTYKLPLNLALTKNMNKLIYVIFVSLISLSALGEVESQCFGNPGAGSLKNGWQLPSNGKNFHAYSSVGVLAGRNYVHSSVYRTVLAAYEILNKSNPSVIYIYGETGHKEGGEFKPHKTHRNGLSVDFFVPVINSNGEPRELNIGITNKLGYNIEFNKEAIFNGLKIDFESIAKHIEALNIAAKKEGIGIEVVIFDNEFQKMLFKTNTGKKLENKIKFSIKKPWVRHDEHYHVNFRVKCSTSG